MSRTVFTLYCFSKIANPLTAIVKGFTDYSDFSFLIKRTKHIAAVIRVNPKQIRKDSMELNLSLTASTASSFNSKDIVTTGERLLFNMWQKEAG